MACNRPAAERATSWLSCDLAEFADAKGLGDPDGAPAPRVDVVIVGSGYGGAMALHGLAGWGTRDRRPLKIVLFERGQEYLSGAFPARMSDLAGHMRFATAGDPRVHGVAEGLFDLRLGPDMCVLVGNGLGGGSLINAGVMARPLLRVFREPAWPAPIRGDPTIRHRLRRVAALLQAHRAVPTPLRAAAMDALGGAAGSAAARITVARDDDPAHGIRTCNRCGDCTTGCNFDAKLSLDRTLLDQACLRHPADALAIVCGATVQTFARDSGGGWIVSVWHTETPLRVRQRDAYQVHADKLVLAAGTLGSTELLRRAHKGGLSVSTSRLGERFSGNGDNLFAIRGTNAPAAAAASEEVAFVRREIGPTITRIIDRRGRRLGAARAPSDSTRGDGFVVQDLAVPAPLRRLLAESTATAYAFATLDRGDDATYREGDARPDPAGLDEAVTDRTLLVALIGRDRAQGRLALPGPAAQCDDGTMRVDWPELRDDPRPARWQRDLAAMAKPGHPGADVLANPAWRPLGEEIEKLLDGNTRGPMVSVHPLGGCAMADSAEGGVVNHLGQVFRGERGSKVYADLVILDGAIVPTSLGINPSLTIAMLAQRAIETLRVNGWGWVDLQPDPQPPSRRPAFRQMPATVASPPTWVQLCERMSARAQYGVDGRMTECVVEVELQSRPVRADSLFGTHAARRFEFDPARSRLRIREPEPTLPPLMRCGADVPLPALLLEAPLRGHLDLLRHGASCAPWRIVRAGIAFALNRGLRDAVQRRRDRKAGRGRDTQPSPLEGFRQGLRLASRAGDLRRLDYGLTLEAPILLPGQQLPDGLGEVRDWDGTKLRAVKTLTYGCAANPVEQLTRARVADTPAAGGLRLLAPFAVDLPYFGEIRVPLLRVVSQADQPRALVDLASILAYLARVLLPLHAWTLRLPDRARSQARAVSGSMAAAANRLPGKLPGIPAPEIHHLAVSRGACIRLARYDGTREGARLPPVMTIHGYAAGGTMFAHPALDGGGACGTLYASGHDVWVLDMRSSAGLPTAQGDWKFEEMGCEDIPRAVDHIVSVTGQPQVDIVAHCMGVAMLALGIWGRWRDPQGFDRCIELRTKLHERIRRLVFSQVMPYVSMSPANIARAWIFSWLRHYLKLGAFEFRPEHPGAADDMLDRLLAVTPYPRRDFRRENPCWPPGARVTWVGPRHRMDAFFGVTFKLDNVDDDVLVAIDDFLGPCSLQTMSQVISFARVGMVTDRRGDGSFIVPDAVAGFIAPDRDRRVLALHSADNGLVDYRTRAQLLRALRGKDVALWSMRLDAMGHLDTWLGRRGPQVWRTIAEFLDANGDAEWPPR